MYRGREGTNALQPGWLRSTSWGLILGTCGFALNWFKLELFYGTDLLFGSFFAMLAAGRFGLASAIIAGFVASLCTFLHWNHPWAIVVFSCEALVVGWLYNRRGRDLVFADILFWLLAGIPLSWLLHRYMLSMPAEHSSFIASKQAVNGIFNTLAASVINIALRIRSSRNGTAVAPAPPLRSILFNIILSLILIPVLFLMITDIRGDIMSENNRTIKRVDYFSEAARDIAKDKIADALRSVQALSSYLQGFSGKPVDLTLQHLELTRKIGGHFIYTALVGKNGATVVLAEGEKRPEIGADRSGSPENTRIDKDYPVLSDIILPQSGHPAPAVLVSSPVNENGKVTGHIVASLDLSSIFDSLHGFTSQRRVSATLLDSKKRIIVSTDNARETGTTLNLLQNKTIRPMTHGVNLVTPEPQRGESALQRQLKSTFLKETPIGLDTGWTVVIEAPVSPYIETLREDAQNKIVQMLMIVLAVAAASYWLSKSLARPIAEVASITSGLPKRIIESGELVLPRGCFNEFEILLANISQMADSLKGYLAKLKESNETLELRVAERTKDLETSEKRFRTLVEDVPNLPVQGYDRHRKVIFWNKASEELYGYSKEEACGKLLEDLIIPPEMREAVIAAVDNWVTHGIHIPAGELVLRGKGGKPVHVFSSHVHQVDPSGEPVMYCIDLDIAARIAAEDKVRRLNEELEKIISERTAALDFSNRELEGFCYAISHELRAPIARLQGFCAAMKEECELEADGFMVFYAERINLASQQLRDVVDSILLLSRLSRTELLLEKLNLSEMAVEISNSLSVAAHPRNLQFIIEPGLTVSCDRQLIRLCLENLLGNAVKYSSKKDTAIIEFGRESINGVKTFFVRDNGAGFDMAFVNKLFKPFLRLHNENEFPGTGIGLVTVARIIERHGGKVWAEGAEGVGATFRFTLAQRDFI